MPMITPPEYISEAESLTILIDPSYKQGNLFSVAKMHIRPILLVSLSFYK